MSNTMTTISPQWYVCSPGCSVPRTQVRTSAWSPTHPGSAQTPRENLELVLSIQNQAQKHVFSLP